MRAITEQTMLVRGRLEFPDDAKIITEEFREGWSLFSSVDVRSLSNTVRKCGLSLIRTSDGSLRSGVGDTSQEATANAVRLALRRVDLRFNTAEIEHIELSQYPSFFLARVRVYPYCIQRGPVLSVVDEVPILSSTRRQRRLPSDAAVLYPQFGSAMPLLKQMLLSSRKS